MRFNIKLISLAVACSISISNIVAMASENKEVWSYYMTAGNVDGAENGAGDDFGDTSDESYYVPIKIRYKGNSSGIPAVIACPNQEEVRPMIYVRPEYEWGVKISDDLAGRITFYPDSTTNTKSGLAQPIVCFTVPEQGYYSISSDFINTGGNKYREAGNDYGDGGWARFIILKNGETVENEQNTEQISLPKASEEGIKREHVNYNKENVLLNKNDKIFLRVSAGSSGEGDCFQGTYVIKQCDENGNLITSYDLYSVSSGLDYGDLTEQYEDAYAVTQKDSMGEKLNGYSEFPNLLVALGLIDKLEIGKYSQDTGITRSEFSQIIIGLLNVHFSEGKESSEYFADVNLEDNPNAIDYLVDSGVIAKAYKFYPDRVITYQEAVKMLVCILGYSFVSDTYGGWPEGYLKVAAQNNLTLNGVQPTDPISRRQAIELVYKCLDCDVLIKEYNTQADIYKKGNKQTILTEYLEVYYDKGIVDGMDSDSLTAPYYFGDNVSINGKMYECNYADIKEYYGMEVDFYYTEISGNDTIIYAEPTDNNYIYEVDGPDIDDLTLTNISYSDNGRVVKKKIDNTADILFNGRAITFSDSPINHMTDDCYVKLIDNDGDRHIDVVFIESYKNYIVENVDTINNLVFVKNTEEGLSFDDSDWENFEMYSDENRVLKLEDITGGEVISVFDTADGKNRKVIVSSKIVNGKICDLYDSNDNGYFCAKINDIEYNISRSRNPVTIGEIILGVSGDLLIDFKGKIVGSKKLYDVYSYLIKVMWTEDDKGIFRIVNGAGEIVDYSGSLKMTYNGQSKLSGNDVVEKIRNEYPENVAQPISIKMSGSEIKRIVTADAPDGVEGKFYIQKYDEYLRFGSRGETFGGKIFTNDSTLYFDIPEECGVGSKATVGSVSSLINWQDYSNIIVLKKKKNAVEADAIFTINATSRANIPETTPVFIVSKLHDVVGDDGEIYQSISGYYNGEYKTYITANEDTLRKVKPFQNASLGEFEVGVGDIIRVGINSDGKVASAEIFYDASASRMLAPNPYTNFMGADYVLYANVYDKQEGFVMLTKNDLTQTDITLTDYLTFRINRVYVVDFNEKKVVQEGGYNDIKAYLKNGSQYSKVVISQSSAIPRELIIYR